MGAIVHVGDAIGATPPIDDSSVSDKKLWSSDKTNTEIEKLAFTEKTYSGTTNAEGTIGSNLEFNPKRIGMYANVSPSGTAFAYQRPYGGNLTAFFVTNGTTITANKSVTIHYLECNS